MTASTYDRVLAACSTIHALGAPDDPRARERHAASIVEVVAHAKSLSLNAKAGSGTSLDGTCAAAGEEVNAT